MIASDVFAMAAAQDVAAASVDIDVFVLLMTLFGGLALFLHGLDRMTDALRVVAGDRLRGILSRLTSNRVMGVLTGASITAVIQSSSVTTVLVVGFVTSGLMTLSQSIGVIMGANIGTTVTAQIIAFKVTKYALLLVASGFALTIASKNEERRTWGTVLMGLGLIFFGMGVMGDAMRPLRTYQPFIDAMAAMSSPLVGIGTAAAFTALVQSSSATTALVIVMAGEGLIPLDAGIALILGANIGTSITAILAALGKPRDAQRAALVHTIFNVAGVILWLPFIGVLAEVVGLVGGGVGREIANAHTIFNVGNTLVFVMFTGQLAFLVERLLPERPAAEEAVIRAKYLDRELLRTPSLALDRGRLEIMRMADRVLTMLQQSLAAVLHGPRSALTEVEAMDDEVDALHGHIVHYLGEISKGTLGERNMQELIGLMEATNNLEAIGDIIETNLVTLGYGRIESGLIVSDETRTVLKEFHHEVVRAYETAMVAVTQRNREAATAVSAMKDEVNSMEREAAAHQAQRLVADEPNRIEAYRFEMDVIAHLKRIYYFAKRSARVAVPVSERASS